MHHRKVHIRYTPSSAQLAWLGHHNLMYNLIIRLDLTMHCARRLSRGPLGICFQRLVACHHWHWNKHSLSPKLRPCVDHAHLPIQQTRVVRIIWNAVNKAHHCACQWSVDATVCCAKNPYPFPRCKTPNLLSPASTSRDSIARAADLEIHG